MLPLLVAALGSLVSLVGTRKNLALENLALRQQLVVLRRANPKRLRLKSGDRIFWAWLSRVWASWADVLVLVRPDTVVRWHRRGFRLFWRWMSQGAGRSPVSKEIRALIRRMAAENLGWGAPRIHGELLKLGFLVAKSTVSALMPTPRRPAKPPSQTWRVCWRNPMDFFVIPATTLQVLYGFVVLVHRRRIRHVAVTAHPTVEWLSQQLR